MALGGARHWVKAALSCTVLMGGLSTFALAADSHSPSAGTLPENKEDQNKSVDDPAKSLQTVLEQAGAQGLLKLEGDTPQSPNRDEAPVKPNTIDHDDMTGPLDCQVTTILDMTAYQSIVSYEDVRSAKTALEAAQEFDVLLPLAKTYIAIGFGSEASALAQNFDQPEARLLEAWGRTVDGSPDHEDAMRLSYYRSCNRLAEFWSFMAYATGQTGGREYDPGFTRDSAEILDALPPILQTSMMIRAGIVAAEHGETRTASRLLGFVEPQTRMGEMPSVKQPDRLYLTGLVKQLSGDESSAQIFKHLGEHDGVYRTKSLLNLAEHQIHGGKHTFSEISADLKAVQQQYDGAVDARKVTLEVLRQHLRTDQILSAIDLAKEDLPPDSLERLQAVNFVGDHVSDKLQMEDRQERLYALNGYFYDPSFFLDYRHLAKLKSLVIKAALELNLPELVKSMATADHSVDKQPTKEQLLSQARLAFKRRDYKETIELSQDHLDDDRFKSLTMEASLRMAGEEAPVKDNFSERLNGEDKARFDAGMAWKNGQWQEAGEALRSMQDTKPAPRTQKKISLADYINRDQVADVKTYDLTDLDALASSIGEDVNLLKEYLDDG